MSTLADLRRQNIAEQKGEDSPTSVDTEVRTSALPQASDEKIAPKGDTNSASTEIRTSASTQARKQASKDAGKQAPKSARKEVCEDASAHSLAEKVREALETKRIYIGGVKATVDMSPELSKRAKKYCLENDVSSVRVLCLELLDAYLTEEGF